MPTEPTPFSIATVTQDGRAVLTVRGELDLATAPELEQALREYLEGGSDVVLDLRELEFIDSSGVRVVVTAHRRAAESDVLFAVVRPPRDSPAEKVLMISGLESQITLLDHPSQLD